MAWFPTKAEALGVASNAPVADEGQLLRERVRLALKEESRRWKKDAKLGARRPPFECIVEYTPTRALMKVVNAMLVELWEGDWKVTKDDRDGISILHIS